MEMVIGLTGGIACGKSTVAGMLAMLGSIIIDADKVAREVVQPGEEGLQAVIQRFGTAVLLDNGELNRKALGEVVFADEQARKDLNSILHPLIRKKIEQKKRDAQSRNHSLIVLDIPLLFESRLQQTVEAVVVVYVPEALQLERLMVRDNLSRQEALLRIHSQMSIEEKRGLADYVIDNSGTIENTQLQVERLYFNLCRET